MTPCRPARRRLTVPGGPSARASRDQAVTIRPSGAPGAALIVRGSRPAASGFEPEGGRSGVIG
jgi:hypothetical protein